MINWIPLHHDEHGATTDFPHHRDGQWVLVTDGENVSVERIKKDAIDHFYRMEMSKYVKIDDLRLHLKNLVLDGALLDLRTTRLILQTITEMPIYEFDDEHEMRGGDAE